MPPRSEPSRFVIISHVVLLEAGLIGGALLGNRAGWLFFPGVMEYLDAPTPCQPALIVGAVVLIFIGGLPHLFDV